MLITEGPTDQEVLKAILTGYYQEDHDFLFLRPQRDATDEAKQEGRGGWEMVFEHCENSDDLWSGLLINDYLVIQIDTDCGDERNFGVALTSGGADRPERDIIEDVQNLLISKLGTEFYEEFRERIIFAISVHSLECWLLPLHITPARNTPKEIAIAIKKSSQTKSCADRLGRHFEETRVIEYKKDVRTYRALARGFLNRANIDIARQRNMSFDVFIASLPEVSTD